MKIIVVELIFYTENEHYFFSKLNRENLFEKKTKFCYLVRITVEIDGILIWEIKKCFV